jgi:hypothetical protein
MPKLITPINCSSDGGYHSANGPVKRVFDTNGLGQLIEVPFEYWDADYTAFVLCNQPCGQIYAMTKLGK